MKILFCKIAHMKYYKGIHNPLCEDDIPYSKGKDEPDGYMICEECNFKPIETLDGKKCYGFVQRNGELHIEKINGCELMKKEDSVNDVLVVWCTYPKNSKCVIVGWYKHATVHRNYPKPDNKNCIEYYNMEAASENCVLLPENIRTNWNTPKCLILQRNYYTYANTPELEKYAEEISERINEYDGENWIDKYPH